MGAKMREDWFAPLRRLPARPAAHAVSDSDVGDAGDVAVFPHLFASPADAAGAVTPETLADPAGARTASVTDVTDRVSGIGDAKTPLPSATSPASPTSPPGTIKPATDGRQSPIRWIGSAAGLELWIGKIRTAGTFAIDTETSCLVPMTAELIGVSLAVGDGNACYIPVAHNLVGEQLERDQVLAALKPVLADARIRKVLHHAKFDVAILHRYGVEVTAYDDTLIASYALNSGVMEHGNRQGHGLKELARRHLGVEMVQFADVVGRGRKKVAFRDAPIEIAAAYAATDPT